MRRVLEDVEAAGMRAMSCLSTRTVVPFYQALGIATPGPRGLRLRPGIVFPSVEMQHLL